MAASYSFSAFVYFLVFIEFFVFCHSQRLIPPSSKQNDFGAAIAADARAGQQQPYYAPPPFALDAALRSPNSRVFIAPPPNPQYEKHFRDAISQPSVIIVVQNGTAPPADFTAVPNAKSVENNNDASPRRGGGNDVRQKLIYMRTAHMRRQPTLGKHRQHNSHRKLHSFHQTPPAADPNNNSNFIPQISPTDFLPSSLFAPPFQQQPFPQQQQRFQGAGGDPIKPLDANEPFMTSPGVQTEGEQPDEILDAPQQRRHSQQPAAMLDSRSNLPNVPPPMMPVGSEGPFGRGGLPPMMPFGGDEGGMPPQFSPPIQPNLNARVGFRQTPNPQATNPNIFSNLDNAIDMPGGVGGGNGPTAPMGALEIADNFEPGATFGNGNRGGFDGIPGGNNMDFFMNRAMGEMDRTQNAVDTVITANRMPTLNNGQPVNSSSSVTNVDPAHSLVSSSTVYRDPNSGGMGYFSEFKLLPNGQLSGGGNDMPLTNALKNNLKAEGDGSALGRRSGIMQDELPVHYPNDDQQQPMWFPPPPFLFNNGQSGGAALPSKSLEELADKVLAAKKIRPLTSKASSRSPAVKPKRVNRRKVAKEKLHYPQ